MEKSNTNQNEIKTETQPETTNDKSVKKIRNIGVVSSDLYELIPDDNEKNKKMKYEIKKYILDPLPFKPPEIIFSQYFWNQLQMIINQNITLEDYNNIEWCKTFIDIYQDPNYKIEQGHEFI